MNKKTFGLLASLLAGAILAGCGGSGTAHTHTPGEAWDWNSTEHYHLCECGEKLDAAAHSLSDDLRCTECGVEIWDMGEGCVNVYSYDEYGNCLKDITFGADGEILSQFVHEYEYDDQGNIILDRYFCDGLLQSQDEYVPGADGCPQLAKSTIYQEDGSHSVCEYDKNGDLIHFQGFDADGSMTSESWSEYATDDAGNSYEARLTEVYGNGEKLIVAYNPYGDATLREQYDADGNLTSTDVWEYGYNEDGKSTWEKAYTDGRLVREIVSYSEYEEDGFYCRYPDTIIDYYDDGTKLVSQFGENTAVAIETLYNADGSVSYVYNYIYETFDDGNWKSIKVYTPNGLFRETVYVMDAENTWSRKDTTTEYHDDGTVTVYTYDEFEEVVSEVHLDADGNVIP